MNITAERINLLAKVMHASTYLEVGVSKGDTFFDINLSHKSAVDPSFQFDLASVDNKEGIFFFAMTSDIYFEDIDYICRNIYKQDILFDIVYIDGLHTFEQSYRDFTNSLSHANDNTLWIFDDTVPCDPWSAIPDVAKSFKYRAMANSKINPWHGDVFKTIFAIHDYYPDFSYVTVIDHGNPQTVVWRTKWNSQRRRLSKNFTEINSISYFDMLDNIGMLNPILNSEIIDCIGSCFVNSRKCKDDILKYIVHPFF